MFQLTIADQLWLSQQSDFVQARIRRLVIHYATCADWHGQPDGDYPTVPNTCVLPPEAPCSAPEPQYSLTLLSASPIVCK